MKRKILALLGLVLLAGLAIVAEPAPLLKSLQGERVVVVACGLPQEDFLSCSAAIAAVNPRAILLRDSKKHPEVNRGFLDAFQPEAVVALGTEESLAGLAKRLGDRAFTKRLFNAATLHDLFPVAEQVVFCPAENRRLLLQATCLAGTLKAPLVVIRADDRDTKALTESLKGWKTKTVFGVGAAASQVPEVEGLRTVTLADEDVLVRQLRRELAREGRIQTVVMANAADSANKLGNMSLLAPWLALQRKALLVLTNDQGTNTREALQATSAALKIQPDTLLLAATLKAIPTEKRPNPVKGKDVDIEMEPLTPQENDPFSFATGRLFHESPAVVLAQVARNRLLEKEGQPRRALVVSNPGGGLPLLETFSRHTARELRNGGYQTLAWFGDEVAKDAMRKALPDQDIFLWEGHYKTLIDEFKFLTWTEPLPPALFFLQSCLALKEAEAGPLIQRGAVAVVGSSTRTYSATGGSFTLAFMDAMVYDSQTLGGALRQAKNFLLAYSLLKEKRLGEKAKLKGVNVRSSWAFTLWGDPTLKLPHPPRPAKGLDPVYREVKTGRLTITLPEAAYDKVNVGKYEATMLPNARLAGLLRAGAEVENNRMLVPFVFAEVPLPKAPTGVTPQLTSRIPERNWVFIWDGYRKSGYLLVTPRTKDDEELKFRVEYPKGE